MLQAAGRKIIDYSTYDGSEAWRRREELLLLFLRDTLIEEVSVYKLNFRGSLIASGKYKDSLAEETTELLNSVIEDKLPWNNQVKKAKASALSGSPDKLIEEYKRTFGNG